MSGNSITIMLQTLGVQNVQQAAQSLQALRAGIQGVQALSGYGSGILPQMVTPMAGLSAGGSAYVDHNRQLTDQAKQIRDLTQTYKEYESQIYSLGRAYGYTTDQMTQMQDAVKQLQGTGFRAGTVVNSAAYARLVGMDPVAMTQSLAGFAQQGVGTTGGQQQQFIGAIEQAVMRGSQGGYTVLTSQLLPLLSNLNQAALNRNPYGYGMGGAQASLDFLSSAYQTGIPGLRGQGAANLYNQLDQTLTSSNTGMAGAVTWQAYQQAHPGSNYFQFDVGREAGMQDPAYAKALIQQVRRVAGDDPTRRAALAKEWGIVSSAHQWMAVEATYGQDTNPQDYQAILKRVGARTDIDTGAVGLIGQLEGTKDQAGIDAVIKQYEDLSGKTYGGKRDKASVEKMLGQIGANGLMGNQADTISAAQADMGKNYEEAQQSLGKYIVQMNKFNDAVSGATNALIHFNPQGAAQMGAVASIGGPILGGAVSAGMTALLLARTLGVGPTAAGVGGALSQTGTSLANAFPSVAQFLGRPAATAATAPLNGPGTSMIFGKSGALGGEAMASLAVPLALIAAGGYTGYQALHEQPKRDAAAEAARSEAEKESRYQTYEKDKREGGAFAAILHPKYLFMDDAQTKDIQAREARDKAGGDKAKTTTGGVQQSPADDMLAVEKGQLDLLTKIEQHLAITADFDRKVQNAYGPNAPKTANMGGPVAPYVASGPNANATSTGNAQYGSVPGTGTPGQGFGSPSVEQVEAQLKGTKLEGYGAQIIQYANENGVPVSVAMGILREESGFNTPAGGTKNNFGGLKGSGGSGAFADFPDIGSGLKAVIGNMGSGIYQGLSLSDFVNKYLGGAAGGDPNKYLNDMIQMISQMGGSATPSSVPVQKGGGGGSASSGVAALLAGAGSRAGGAAAGMLGGGGGPLAMVGRLDLTIKMPDGSTQRQWVDMAPTSGQPFGGIQNWPTRGSDM